MDITRALQEHGIRPSSQRTAVAEYVLRTADHPTADQVFKQVRARCPAISRATVYNTLNLFVDKGLVRELVLNEGPAVFDPNVERHHHFIDEDSGAIHDVPWNRLEVCHVDRLRGLDVRDYQVVLRGRLRPSRA